MFFRCYLMNGVLVGTEARNCVETYNWVIGRRRYFRTSEIEV